MKIFVKTLKGSHFEIQVQPQDTVADVKKNIETVQGTDVYPAAQQMLIHQGKVLKDGTTLDENKVAENSFIVIMLTKNKSSSGGSSSTTQAAPVSKAPQNTAPAPAATPVSTSEVPLPTSAPPATITASSPAPAPVPAPAPAPVPATSVLPEADVYSQAASNLVAGSNLEETIEQILLMGGGLWDRDIVVRALRAAYNNPERAVDYLYSGIPEQEAPPAARVPSTVPVTNPSAQPAQPAQPGAASVPSTGPNANPLDLFPQGLPNLASGGAVGSGSLDFLRNSPQFQALRAMVRANPQILQPMLQELGKQNPQLIRLIQDHQPDFLRLINEPLEGEGNVLGQLADATQHAITVTPEERDAIQRVRDLLEASKKHETLDTILDGDVANDTVKTAGSHSRNLRRVRQGLDLIRAIFEQFMSTDDYSLRVAASTAYTKVCAPYHTWTVRTAVSAGMYTLPTREQLLLKLNETNQSAEKKMKRYIDASGPVINYIDKLYISRNISLDW